MQLLIFNNHTDTCTHIPIQNRKKKTRYIQIPTSMTFCPDGGREIENKHNK